MTIKDVYGEFLALNKLISENFELKNVSTNLHHIPVCYAPEFAWDMDWVSEHTGLTKSEIINLHTAPEYLICFIGFLPGFPYLHGMDERLHIPRKKEPRLQVGKGAVGLAENQTGIYPKTSPGGWQILGRSPVDFFDPETHPPTFFWPGDCIRFEEVDLNTFRLIEERVKSGEYVPKTSARHG